MNETTFEENEATLEKNEATGVVTYTNMGDSFALFLYNYCWGRQPNNREQRTAAHSEARQSSYLKE